MKRILFHGVLAGVFIMLASINAGAQSSVESLMSNGQEMLQRGAYSQAVTAFRQALAKEPDFFEAQFNLGFAYLQWGGDHMADAVRELKKAIKMQPRNSEAWSNLAIAYDNMGKTSDATDALAQAVNSNPENLTARMNLAAMYANANKTQQAIAQYRQVVKVDGTNSDALLNLGKCLVTAGSAPEAKGYLKQAIVAAPGKGDAHAELGTIYWKKDNDIDKGIAEYRLAISAEPSNPAFYESLATALETKKQTQDAIETWRKSLIYIDDAMQKEKVQDRIDRLEKGETAASSTASYSETGSSSISKQQTKDLERELRNRNPGETRRLETQSVDVNNDFKDVANDTSTTWDLSKEAKKRAQERKGAQTR